MLKFSKIFLGFTVAVLLMWQLPWCWSFFTAKPSKVPFTLYSSVSGEFVSIGHEEGQGLVRRDQSGRTYTQEQTDSLLPFFYIRQLVADERFPDTIQGRAITPREVQAANFSFRMAPSEVNARRPALYPLLESMSGRVDLTMPDDVFRITSSGIEFVKMKANSVDAEKSQLFTTAMRNKGFRFPARRVAGNPTTRKDYDEGYLLLDSAGSLFHLKRVAGRPYVRAIPLPQDVQADRISLTEFRDRKTLGFLTDTEGRFYVLLNKTYELVQTGVKSYFPERDGLTIFGNMLDWTVCVSGDDEVCYYALDADSLALISSLVVPQPGGSSFGLHFTSADDKKVTPRF